MMRPVTASLRKIIPTILLLAGLIFFSAAYLQINQNLKKEVVKTSIHHVQQIMESLQRSINNVLSENNWDKAEKELMAITYDASITELFLVSNNGQVILANNLSVKNTQFSNKQLQLFFKNGAIKPSITSIDNLEVIAIYPVYSPLKGGEFRSKVLGALYLKYSLNSIMNQYQSIFHENIWVLFVTMLLILFVITIILHMLVVHPVEFLTRIIRQERNLNKPVTVKLKGKGEIAILADEFNKREQLICQQFEQIKDKENLLQRAQEISHVGICNRELHSNEMTCSEELYRIIDRSEDVLLANFDSYESCIHFSDRNRYSALLTKLRSRPSSYQIEYRIIRPDKSIRFIREQGEIKEVPEKNKLHLVSVIQDITEQEQSKNFIEISPVVIFRWKAEENWPVDFVTQNISQFGYTREDFISGQIKFNNIIHPEDRDKVAQEVGQYTQENKDTFTQVYRIITHDGAIRWIDDRTTIERSTSGKALFYTGIILDVTHSKQIENEYQALGTIVSNSLNEVYIFDKDSLQFTYMNHAAEENIAYSLDEMLKMTPIDIQPEITAEQFLSTIKPLDNEPQKKIVFETTHQRKDGTDYYAEIHLQLMNYKEREQYIAIVLDISKRKESLISLEQSETKYRRLVENLRNNYVFYTHDTKGVFTYLSESITEMLGYSQDEFIKHYDTYLTDDPINKKIHFYTKKTLQGKKQLPYEVSAYHKDGSIRYIEVTELPLFNDKNEIIGVEGIAKDITERYRSEKAKEDQKFFLQSIIDGIKDPVMVIDKNYNAKLINNAIRDMMDVNVIADSEHPKCYEVSHQRTTPCDGKDHICPLKEVIASKKSIMVVHNHFNHLGERQYMELSSTPLWDHEHNLMGVIESARDITAHLQVQDELREQKNILAFQANHDHLTQLPNRLLLSDRLEQSLKKAHRNKQKTALMFIDLDHFKEINDSFGHKAGDEILKEMAVRLQLCVRDADTVARLGGDEFIVLIEDIIDDESITHIAVKIIESMQEAFIIDKESLYVTTSIGISLYPDDAELGKDLLRKADAAMYKAKEEGRNTYRFYTEDMLP